MQISGMFCTNGVRYNWYLIKRLSTRLLSTGNDCDLYTCCNQVREHLLLFLRSSSRITVTLLL
jgi:hypothetical protein